MARTRPAPSDLYPKYLDWCSARLLERLRGLPPEEVWRLAQATGAPESVDRVVQHLSRELLTDGTLPDLERWCDAYRDDPQRMERDLAGFTRRDLPPGVDLPLQNLEPDAPAPSESLVWHLFQQYLEAELGERPVAPTGSAAIRSPSVQRARKRARTCAERQLHALGWQPTDVADLVRALETEAILWIRDDGSDRAHLARRLRCAEERFRATRLHHTDEGLPCWPVVLADSMYVLRADPEQGGELCRVPPQPDARSYVSDGTRYGVRYRCGRVEWFDAAAPAGDATPWWLSRSSASAVGRAS